MQSARIRRDFERRFRFGSLRDADDALEWYVAEWRVAVARRALVAVIVETHATARRIATKDVPFATALERDARSETWSPRESLLTKRPVLPR